VTEHRSSFRVAATAVIRRVLERAIENRLDARAQRRALRLAFRQFLNSTPVSIGLSPRSCWYAAVRDVTGGGVLDLTDPRQQPLPIEVGPRRSRVRRKDTRRDR
jgi:hypothetical protein